MVNFLLRPYWAIERVIAAGLRYSQDSYEEALRGLITPRTVWLDVGCGHQVLPEWRLDAERGLVSLASYVAGIDKDPASLAKHRTIANTSVGRIESLPFPDNSFNLVTANMVVEHLAEPACAFGEIRRILRRSGVFLFHTPNLHGYRTAVSRFLPSGIKKFAAKVLDGRDSHDVYPTFYRCNLEQAINNVARQSQLEVRWIRHIPTTATLARVLPLAALELLWISVTMRESMARLRANILCLLEKTA